MKNQNPQQSPEKQAIDNGRGVGIPASPFNGVKLELGFAIIIGIIVWSVADIITPLVGKQLILLAGYGLIAAIWLVMRTRQVVKKHRSELD